MWDVTRSGYCCFPFSSLVPIDKCMRRVCNGKRGKKKEIYTSYSGKKGLFFFSLSLSVFPYYSLLWVTINLTIHLLRANKDTTHLLKELQVKQSSIHAIKAGSALLTRALYTYIGQQYYQPQPPPNAVYVQQQDQNRGGDHNCCMACLIGCLACCALESLCDMCC